jgi:hypothetical protein
LGAYRIPQETGLLISSGTVGGIAMTILFGLTWITLKVKY